jgi:hypothetical protein
VTVKQLEGWEPRVRCLGGAPWHGTYFRGSI